MTKYEGYLKEGVWTQKEYQLHVTPLTAFTLYADAGLIGKKHIKPF